MNKQSNKDPASKCRIKQNISLRDIARELDISHATVSLALRSHPRISAATQARVKEKADAMGYYPDPVLSVLSHYRQTCKESPRQATLAWINPFRSSREFYQYNEYKLYWKGAKEAARLQGLELTEFTTESFSLKQIENQLKAQHIRGVVVAPVTGQAASMEWNRFPWQDFSAVRFGRSAHGPSVHSVTSAQVSNTMTALKKVVEKGYKRIGFVGFRAERRLFVAGYLGSQCMLPDNRMLSPLLVDPENPARNRQDLKQWLKANEPDAILTDHPLLPSLLNELGFSVPQDIGLATLSIHDTPIDAGIDQNPQEIGRTVIHTLVSLLNEHHFGIPAIRNSILVDGRWVDGSMLPDRS
ncbi:LacI family DNA-binding transcriptional regulator [Pontiellaceae bacterium B12219]|nr:LacI family DNA-binding transcriptional regulator [Pontiellaceae bacterium B12219]